MVGCAFAANTSPPEFLLEVATTASGVQLMVATLMHGCKAPECGVGVVCVHMVAAGVLLHAVGALDLRVHAPVCSWQR